MSLVVVLYLYVQDVTFTFDVFNAGNQIGALSFNARLLGIEGFGIDDVSSNSWVLRKL